MAVSTLLLGSSELRKGGASVSFDGKKLDYSETYNYLVKDTSTGGDRADRDDVLFGTSGLPIPGYFYNTAGYPCTSSNADRDEKNTRYWRVTCVFSSASNDQKPSTDPGVTDKLDPTTWIPVFKMGYEVIQIEAVVDGFGKPIVNSAKAPFDRGIVKNETVTTFTFHQYFPDTKTEAQIQAWNGAVNSKSFKGFDKYKLLLEVIGSERGIFNGYDARRVEFVIKCREGVAAGKFKEWNNLLGAWQNSVDDSGWRDVRVDAGPYYLSPIPIQRISCKTDDAARLAGNQGLLDGSGALLSANADPILLGYEPTNMLDFKTVIRT